MNTVSGLLAMVAAASLTLGIIHLRFWLSQRDSLDRLAFALLCFSTLAYSWFEIALLHADSPVSYGEIIRWTHIPAWGAMVTAAWFLYLNLGTGRRWLFGIFIALRTLTLVVNFIVSPNVNFQEITSIDHCTMLGETVSIPVGVRSPWALIPQASILVLIIFCLDSVVKSYRRGDRQRAVIMGGGVTLFAVTVILIAITVPAGLFHFPLIVSPALLFVTAGMGYELNRDLYRMAFLSKQLARREEELSETLKQLDLSADAGSVGMWMRTFADDRIKLSEKMRELFGLDHSTAATYDDILQRVHPADRRRVQDALTEAISDRADYHVDYRLVMPDGGIRWIDSRGRVEFNDGRPNVFRGASVDITKRKLAEDAAHELSRKLMTAQEAERSRLARELHDGISQSLALLSIQLSEIVRHPRNEDFVEAQVDYLSTQIQRIAGDIYRISHQLHPAKLSQLGLVAAVGGLCRELETGHHVKIDLESSAVPESLPDDVALCLYRVAQEALQNVIKHSGAGSAHVSISAADGYIRLLVSDNGCGFDPKAKSSNGSLGLVSIAERVRAVRGTVQLDSSPNAGARIDVQVPIESNNS